MAKAEVIEKVKAVKDAPSCYEGLKKVCEEYLAAAGTDGEKAAADKLKAALKECVNSIDDMLGFVVTDDAKKYLAKKRPRVWKKQERKQRRRGRNIVSALPALPVAGCWIMRMSFNF